VIAPNDVSATILSVHLRIFLSSPGDVADERDRAQRVIEGLAKDPFVRSRATLEAVRWDDPDAPTPMPANLPPQEAVNRGLAKPSDCDVVVVILWSRMGTPLDLEIYSRPNGEPYMSGTEWEYEEAINAPTAPDKPIVLVYRRIDEPRIGLSDPDLDQKRKQYSLVGDFFTRFRNPDGSLKGGISEYEGPSAFEERLKKDLRNIVKQQLEQVGGRPSRGGVTSEMAPAAIWRGSPYPGLRAFDESEAPVFFGRGTETDALLRQIRQLETGFCAVIGASGSGKSSLVRAGLIPRLKANAVPGSKDWVIVTFKPGELGPDPFLPLATELQRSLPPHERASAPADLAATLAGKPEAISTWGRATLPADCNWARLLLIVDQFEELFTLATEDRQPKFIEVLEHAAADRKLLVVATMRADFFAEASSDDRLAQLLRTGTFPLAPPGPAALVEAIRRPAEQAGIEVPSNLVDAILQDVGSGEGALPLVAFCLSELWPQKEGAEPRLTLDAYNELGHLRGAIERRAGQIVGRLGEAERAALPDMFQYLIQVSADGTATRRRVSKVLLDAEPRRARLVKALVDGRLLTSSKDPDAQVEAAHEALFDGWPDLRQWLADNRALLQLRSEIETAMARWRRKGQDPEFLLVGKWLTEAMQFAADRPELLGPDMLDFIRASETGARTLAEHDQAGLRRECLRRAELSRQQTDSGNSRLGILLALEALPEDMKNPNRPYVPEAESALYHAIWSSPEAALLPGHKGPISAIAFSPDGQRIVSADEEGNVHLWHGATGARVGNLKGHTGPVNAAALSHDGKRILTVSGDGTAWLWDGTDGRSIACLRGHTGPVSGGAFSPDGHYVLTGSHDHTACLWDGISGAHRVTLQGHTGPITAVAFSLDCHRVVTASQDGTARVWRTGTATLLAVLKSQFGPITAAMFGCEDRRVITLSSNRVMEFWQVTSGAGPAPHRIQVGPLTAITFSRDRKFVVTGCADRSALLWDGLTGTLVASLEGHTGPVTAAAFSHDGARILTGSSDGALKLWDARLGYPLSARSTLEGHKEQATAVALSPDGKRIVAGFKDGLVRL
jgi:WD40 repeat protein